MIYEAVQTLINYAIKNDLISTEDVYVVRNGLIDLLHLSDWKDCEGAYYTESIDDILKPIIDYACEEGLIADTTASRDLFDTKIMGVLTLMPREVIAKYNELYKKSPLEATKWYYDYNQKINYVRTERIKKDLRWKYSCEYGELDITINCSKPEKDPRDIMAARNEKSSKYPMCQLCVENMGFAGSLNHPARQNLRPVPMTADGEQWYLQYSPYGYFNEHCIVFNGNHTPMKIDASAFRKLFDVVDSLPHYLIGSNADLPIVGGSILSHDHFQGGNYTFPMQKAPVEKSFDIPSFPEIKCGIVKWPMSVIRLSSCNRNSLCECAVFILEKWRSYSDEDAQILSHTDGVPHNTVTPIVWKNGEEYTLDIVLRNNRTTEERPLGIFHPGPSLHHIKKENIGLIEVMGLAVLPARLAKNIKLLEEALLSGKDISAIPELEAHADWAKEIIKNTPNLSKDNAEEIIKHEIGKVFLEVLIDAGVFKRNEKGKDAFMKFIDFMRR